MGIEGHESPRDVASEDKKHPWEIFPVDETSANDEGRKKREKAEKNNEKESNGGFKKWVKTHLVLFIVIIILIIAAIAGAIFGVILLNNKKEGTGSSDPNDPANYWANQPVAPIMYEYPENFELDDAITAYHAFNYANTDFKKAVALAGVDEKKPDPVKVEDNMDLYVDSLKSENEKIYYRLFTAYLVSYYGNTERGKFLLELFEEEKHTLTKNQRYVYYMAYEEYYFRTGDNDNFKKYQKLIQDDPEFIEDGFIFLDEETGERITDEEMINALKNAMSGENKGDAE